MNFIKTGGYKAFNKSQTLNLAPITLLIGPNGAGKSSLINLIKSSKKIITENGLPADTLHNPFNDIDVFKDSDINRGNNKNEIHLAYPIDLNLFRGDYSVEFIYQLSTSNRILLTSITIQSEKHVLLKINVDFERRDNRIIESQNNLNVSLTANLEMIESNFQERYDGYVNMDFSAFGLKPEEITYELSEEMISTQDQLMKETIEAKKYLDFKFSSLSSNIYDQDKVSVGLNSKTSSFERNNMLEDAYEKWRTQNLKEQKYLNIVKADSDDTLTNPKIQTDLINDVNESFIKDLKKGQVNFKGARILNWVDFIFNSTDKSQFTENCFDINLDFATLSSLNLQYLGVSDKTNFLLKDVLFNDVILGLKKIQGLLGNQNHINANRNISKTDEWNKYKFSSEVTKMLNSEFLASNLLNMITQPSLEFLKFWSEKFGMKKSLNFKTRQEFLDIIQGTNAEDLEDMGFGMLQLLPLIGVLSSPKPNDYWNEKEISKVKNSRILDEYTVESLFFNNGKFIMIEEPEANLHPNFQSKIADLIIDSAWKFNNQFLIETHSEYLVRKLQYWVAKGKILPEVVQIYYFTQDEKKGTQIKSINILKDGSLSGEFGDGFYDEADRISLELYMTQLAQQN